MMIEQNLQDQLLRRDQLKLASVKAREQLRPKDTNVYNLYANNEGNQKQIFSNEQWIKDSEQIMGGKWDPKVGGWRGEDGNVLQFNDYEMSKKMAAIDGISESTFNGPAAWTEQGLALDTQISKLQTSMKTVPKAERIKIARQLSDLQQQRNTINSNLTDGNMLRYYNNQYQKQSGKARFFASMGDSTTATLMQKRATDAQTNVKELIKQINKEKNGGKGTGTTSKHDVYAQMSGYYTVGGKSVYKKKGQWLRAFGHNFKTEGDIMRKIREGETLVRDLKETGDTGSAAADVSRFKVGEARVEKAVLPQALLIPHDEGKAAFRDAVNSRYADAYDKAAPKTAAQATQVANKAVKDTIKKHEELYNTGMNLNNVKRVAGGKVSVVIEGVRKEITPEILQAVQEAWNQKSLDELGYIANWAFGTREKEKFNKK
jgi:hypothetical protein